MKITNNFLLLPPSTRSTVSTLTEAGNSIQDAEKTVKVTGITNVHYATVNSLSSFILDGLTCIERAHPDTFQNLDAVIVISQTYDQRLPSISTRIQNKFGLDRGVYCIDVMDGCNGYVKALSLAEMLQIRGHQRILIVAGDLNSLMTEKAETGTKILFGDGISVTILAATQKENKSLIYNDGDFNDIISCSIADNVLNMNGFEVFWFTKNVVPGAVKTFLLENDETLDNYDLLALHQASALIVNSLASTLKYRNQFGSDFACARIGNLGAGSIGAWLSQQNLPLGKDLKMLVVGYGSGLSWGVASTVINLKQNEVIHVDTKN